MSNTQSTNDTSADSPLHQLRRLSEVGAQDDLKTDTELLALYTSSGDRGAMEILIRRYAPLVASVCRMTVNDTASAEDAFQATFLVLLKNAGKIRCGASVAAWLHGVAYRTACRIRATGRKQLTNQSGDEVITKGDPGDDPLTELARKMELEALDRELERLPEQYRQPMIEHYLLGYSAPEIASRMELSISAVEGRLRRGRRTLRTQLARRGISLSVVLAGAGWFQQHVQAVEATQWTNTFLDAHLPAGGSSAPTAKIDSNLSSLVQGETTMISAGTTKTLITASIALIAGTMAIISATAGDDRPSGSGSNAPTALTLPAVAPAHEVVAQIGIPSEGPTSEGRSIGGTSGGGQASGAAQPLEPNEPTDWERPEEGEDTPSWLAGGAASLKSTERNRAVLAMELDASFEQVPLTDFVKWLSEETNTQFELNLRQLEEFGVTPDNVVSVAGTGSVRELIRRACEPLDLTYVVTESTVEITTVDDAEERLNVRFYDLSYVLPNSANADSLVDAIQNILKPENWDMNGGSQTIRLVGSMMVVSATDTTHQGIEVILLNVSKMHPSNAAKPSVSVYGGFGGGGLGGGGFGGGAGGMGGGGMF
ncbi:MAG: sigma-70 family RNA polymerase sigma factor [Pirellulaceae bacterium]